MLVGEPAERPQELAAEVEITALAWMGSMISAATSSGLAASAASISAIARASAASVSASRSASGSRMQGFSTRGQSNLGFCSFLALVLQKTLLERLAAKGEKARWEEIVRDLARVSEAEISHAGKRFAVRSQMTGLAVKVFRAVGLRIPSVVRQLDRAA